MNDINEMPPVCAYCPYWEVCKPPYICLDVGEQDEEPIQPSCNQLENDTISRKAALNVLNKLDVSDGVGISSVACSLQEEAIRSIEDLPSAQPERNQGHWVGIDDEPCETWECDKCGCIQECFEDELPNYCPNCGSDNRESDDGQV